MIPVLICVQKDIQQPITWALKDFERIITVKYHDKLTDLRAGAELYERGLVLVDSIIQGGSTLDFIKALRTSIPELKVVLIVALGTSKEEVIEIIKAKLVNGVLLRPFSAAQVTDYVYKLCDIAKPSDSPWFARKA